MQFHLGIKFVSAETKLGAFLLDFDYNSIFLLLNGYMGSVFSREVHEEVNKAREKTSELKLRRQEEAIARREKLKLAYLRTKVEKLRAASKTDHTLL